MMVAGNILLFVPMGICIHALRTKKNLWTSMILSLLVVFLVESLQFLLATGSFDVDDILLNFLGAVCGVLAFHTLYLGCGRNASTARRTLSAVALPLLPVLVLSVVEYALWLPFSVIAPLAFIAFAALDILIYLLLFRREGRGVKITYAVSCIVFYLVFLFLFVPLLGPIT